MIKKIKASNFKSFSDIEVELRELNILIGANASGKSNFIRLFGFIRDLKKFGLENAISMQGGIEYLKNININKSEIFSTEIFSIPDKDTGFIARSSAELNNKLFYAIKPYESTYKFSLNHSTNKQGYRILEDNLKLKCNFLMLKVDDDGSIKEKENMGQGEITISKKRNEIDVQSELPIDVKIKTDDIFPFLLSNQKKNNKLLLELPQFYSIANDFEQISIYDFDPKLPKKAIQITGKADLEEDGSNLAIVLKKLFNQKKLEKKFSNLMEDILPFVDNIDVKKLADKSFLFRLKEKYSKNYLPASLISDGTVNITALIVAMYFEKNPMTIIEEPERNIHPHLISKLVSMMKDSSQNKQIIVTTHNPEFIKYADLEDILLVKRDNNGFSIITKPYQKENVQVFLKNELGIENLFVQNILESL